MDIPEFEARKNTSTPTSNADDGEESPSPTSDEDEDDVEESPSPTSDEDEDDVEESPTRQQTGRALDPTLLCEFCQGINIESISAKDGLPFHETLKQMEDCARRCPLCYFLRHGKRKSMFYIPS